MASEPSAVLYWLTRTAERLIPTVETAGSVDLWPQLNTVKVISPRANEQRPTPEVIESSGDESLTAELTKLPISEKWNILRRSRHVTGTKQTGLVANRGRGGQLDVVAPANTEPV